MADPASLALGILGVVGLFKSCIEYFDIVVSARAFSEDFDRLCTELSLQRIRLVLWGQTLGLVPCPDGKTVPYNKAVDRADIRPALEKTLHHLYLLLSKADVVAGRYELQGDCDDLQLVQPASSGLSIFREKFESFKANIRKNQKQKSTWKVTRWSIHDFAKFKTLIEDIKGLIDGLESITSSLGILERQRALLAEEIESISDTKSLRLLQEVASSQKSSPSSKLVSDAASHRLSLLPERRFSGIGVGSIQTDESQSFHTAPSKQDTPSADPEQSVLVPSGSTAQQRRVLQTTLATRLNAHGPLAESGEYSESSVVGSAMELLTESATPLAQTTTPIHVPQHQRIMMDLLKKGNKQLPKPSFASGASKYGEALAKFREEDAALWQKKSLSLLCQANNSVSMARRVFLELRSIRTAGVPFISASTFGDSLDKILASIEGPPDTPYEGGVFWISVKFLQEGTAPVLRFHTRIYHPNIDHTGKLCADYQSWWNDPQLGTYMRGATTSYGALNAAWFLQKSSNHFSLGALLTSLCDLLASPNVEDPLVPEIAEVYVTDHTRFCEAARVYTQCYACGSRPPDHDIVFGDDVLEERTYGYINLPSAPMLSLVSQRATSDITFGSMSIDSDETRDETKLVVLKDLERGEIKIILKPPAINRRLASSALVLQSSCSSEIEARKLRVEYAEMTQIKAPSINDFDFCTLISTRLVGCVYKVTNRYTGQTFVLTAVKKTAVVSEQHTPSQRWSSRVRLQAVHLQPMIEDSKYFSFLQYVFQSKKTLYLVADYSPGGQFFAHARKNVNFDSGHGLDIDTVRFYAAELVVAIERLSYQNKYRNISLEDIFLDKDGHITITDFGVHDVYGLEWDDYSPPEFIRCGNYTRFAYLWFLGCFLFETSSGLSPFDHPDESVTLKNILNGNHAAWSDDIPHALRDLILQLWNDDPQLRLDVVAKPMATRLLARYPPLSLPPALNDITTARDEWPLPSTERLAAECPAEEEEAIRTGIANLKTHRFFQDDKPINWEDVAEKRTLPPSSFWPMVKHDVATGANRLHKDTSSESKHDPYLQSMAEADMLHSPEEFSQRQSAASGAKREQVSPPSLQLVESMKNNVNRMISEEAEGEQKMTGSLQS